MLMPFTVSGIILRKKYSMESNWKLGKQHSNYHFDKWRAEEPGSTFKIIGRFIGDWDAELQEAYNDIKPVTWPSRWTDYGKNDPRGNLSQAEINDLVNAGADPDMIMYRGSKTVGPKMQKMIDELGIEDYRCKLHIQFPGDMVVMHFDKHYEHKDPSNVKRFLIALEDWEPGQFVIFGNDVAMQWKAGDIITFDWENIPHATANASFHKRPFLQAVGTMTDKTRSLINDFKEINI